MKATNSCGCSQVRHQLNVTKRNFRFELNLERTKTFSFPTHLDNLVSSGLDENFKHKLEDTKSGLGANTHKFIVS
jgi:hypothetical protein